MDRTEITEKAVEYAVRELQFAIELALTKHGRGTFASRHEVLGVLDEERTELIGAITSGTDEAVKKELLDVAATCIFGVACINGATMDW